MCPRDAPETRQMHPTREEDADLRCTRCALDANKMRPRGASRGPRCAIEAHQMRRQRRLRCVPEEHQMRSRLP